MSNKTTEELSQLLVDNPKFLETVEKDIEEIKKDGKLDFQDVPTLVNLVVTCYNELDDFHVSVSELPELLFTVAKIILEKYDLVPEGNVEQFESLVKSAVKLVLLVPSVKKCCSSLTRRLNKFVKCLKCQR